MLRLLRKIFGIHSPSKIARKRLEKYGKLIAEGFEEGIKQGKAHPLFIGIDLANGEDFTSPPAIPQK